MEKTTVIKLQKYALTLRPGSRRAQCYRIAGYRLCNETIAERLQRDHATIDGALRAATILVVAGCAIEKNGTDRYFGDFIFDDGSVLKK